MLKSASVAPTKREEQLKDGRRQKPSNQPARKLGEAGVLTSADISSPSGPLR